MSLLRREVGPDPEVAVSLAGGRQPANVRAAGYVDEEAKARPDRGSSRTAASSAASATAR